MKTKYYFTLLALLMLGSCSYLDFDESVGYKKDDVYAFFDRTKQSLTSVYSYLPSDFGSIDGAMRAAATDEAEYVWNTSTIHRFNDGSWSAILTVDDVWDNMYAGIRAANMFLENYQKDFPEMEWNDGYEDLMKQYQYYPYEARFLRAFFHFELAKRYCNIPLVVKTYTTDEINSLKPASFDDIIDFVVSECDQIAVELPVNYADVAGKETGRITRGAAMALKVRALLYAASPLHNEANDAAKWLDAATAASDLISAADADGWYSLVSESAVNNLASEELILETRMADANSFERLNFPLGFEGGQTGMCPTQNLVDAFEMSDGTAFDWENEDHVKNIYNTSHRDPRLFKTVIYNNSAWKGQLVQTFVGGKNGQPQEGATLTSYYLKKYLVEGVNLTEGSATTARHVWVVFRYADVLLSYAEALYEATNNADFTSGEFPLSPREAVNRVRTRAGVVDLPDGDFREQVRNERRVELAFEDQRFWDVRRWKIADQTTDIYGVTITKSGSKYTYTRTLIDERVWNDKMYLYPIANTECFKNTNLIQNPGW